MSLFDDASLVLIPDGAKDGKLYSVKPTDGTGDFTFTRGSNLAATRVDENGLIEKGRENLFTNSNNLPDVTPDRLTRTTGHADPFGGTDAALFTENTATGSHRFFIFNIPASDAVHTYSIYAKPNGRDRFQIVADGGDINAQWNISTGTLIGNNNEIKSNIESVGNGWYRLSLTYYGAGWIGGYFFNDSGSNNYTGDGTSGVYLYGAQVEVGLVATDYIETGATTAQAGILEDLPRIDYSGGASCPALLLEPQRTNVVSNSEYIASITNLTNGDGTITSTSNYAISPEGVKNATRIEASATGSNYALKTYTPISSVSGNYTCSMYIKSNTSSNQSINFYARGGDNVITVTPEWQRFVVVGVGASNFINFGITQASGEENIDILCYGLQMEQDVSYPTSYIPTYGSSVTRSEDSCSNTTEINTDTPTTYFIEFNVESVDDEQQIIQQYTAGDGVGVTINFLGSNSGVLSMRGNDGTDFGLTSWSGLTANTTYKLAFTVNFTTRTITNARLNNTVSDGSVSARISSTEGLYIGSRVDSFYISGGVKQFLIFPSALTLSEIQTLTTI